MARLTRKSYKRKKIVAGAALFMSVALISTGFASFVISGQKTQDASSTISVALINDAGLYITIDDMENLGSFNFEPKEEDNSGRIYASTSEGAKYENLSVKISGSVDNYDHLGSLIIKMEQVDGEGVTKAAEANYIVLPTCMTSPAGEEITVNNEGKFEYTISFDWGTVFGGKNPSIYYDEDDDGKKISDDDMKETLENFRKTMCGIDDASVTTDDLQYKITLIATPK